MTPLNYLIAVVLWFSAFGATAAAEEPGGVYKSSSHTIIFDQFGHVIVLPGSGYNVNAYRNGYKSAPPNAYDWSENGACGIDTFFGEFSTVPNGMLEWRRKNFLYKSNGISVGLLRGDVNVREKDGLIISYKYSALKGIYEINFQMPGAIKPEIFELVQGDGFLKACLTAMGTSSP